MYYLPSRQRVLFLELRNVRAGLTDFINTDSKVTSADHVAVAGAGIIAVVGLSVPVNVDRCPSAPTMAWSHGRMVQSTHPS